MRSDGRREEPDVTDHRLGYRLEVREVERCLAAQALHSPWCRAQDTVAVLEVLDRIAARIGLGRPPPAPLPEMPGPR